MENNSGDIRGDRTYPTYAREFKTYRWYRPIITAAVFSAVYAVLLILTMYTILGLPQEGMHLTYEALDFRDLRLAAFVLSTMAVAIPALMIASRIVKDRPFSSYSSSRGGWRMKVFWVCLLAAALTELVPKILLHISENSIMPENELSLIALMIIIVLGSLQSVAEEYIFRGIFMQTLGAWLKLPVLAVIIQALVFAVRHSYDFTGTITVVISGLSFGLAAYITNGLEAPAAMHIAGNVSAFYFVAAGLTSVSGNVSVFTLVYTLCTNAAFIIILMIIKKKTSLFDKVERDDLKIWNDSH